MTEHDLAKAVRAASEEVHREDPSRLTKNLGQLCYEHVSRTIDLLNSRTDDSVGRFYHVGKTRSETGKVVPPDWRPMRADWRGQIRDLAGVSHDAVCFLPASGQRVTGFPHGVQFDVIGGANHGDAPIGHPASPDGHLVPASEYRESNPPVSPGEWLLSPDPVGQNPGPTPPGVTLINFPPRDTVARFFERLNAFYTERGRDRRTLASDGDPLHVDNEGLFVWLTEFVRHYVVTQSEVLASDATMADIEKAWQ